jgi:hypothetical protein
MPPNLSAHEQDEVRRSSSEASKIVIRPVDVVRYLNPPGNTPFPLEYAFYLLGEFAEKQSSILVVVRGKR